MRGSFNNTSILKLRENDLTHKFFVSMMNSDNPAFIGRIGGSDFFVIQKYFSNKQEYLNNSKGYNKDLKILKQFNGYFDFSNNLDNYIKFLEDMIIYHRQAKYLSYVNAETIMDFDTEEYNDTTFKFLNFVCENKILFSYYFLNEVLPFLNSFKIWGEDKKILIISPFSQSIEYQKEKINDLIKNYSYPNCEILTYNTPITYNHEKDTKEILQITTNNWHDQCALMAEDISNLDFDIAWLSCASYAMFLGDFIQNQLYKKALYVGGILNMYFNIYGKRYDTSFFNELINLNTQITALENQKISSIQGGRYLENEGLNAYFGIKP